MKWNQWKWVSLDLDSHIHHGRLAKAERHLPAVDVQFQRDDESDRRPSIQSMLLLYSVWM